MEFRNKLHVYTDKTYTSFDNIIPAV